jgi:type IV secretory pathway TraG/TraD family ATPase VirD4
MLNVTLDNKQAVLQDFQNHRGKLKKVRSLDVVNSHYLRHNKKYVEAELRKISIHALWIFGIGALAAISFFVLRGRQQYRKKLDRGNQLVPVGELSKSIKKQNAASDLTLDGLPLISHKETSHILVTGTTGAGKTNLFHTLLPQIHRRGDRAVIVDFTGDYVAKYYNPETDVILNPFDQRSPSWSIWNECQSEAQFDAFSEALIPAKRFAQESFWEDASRIILATALKKFHKEGNYSIPALYNLLVETDLRAYHNYFEGTDAATFTDIRGEKTTTSIRSTLASHITFLKYLEPQDQGFSIRNWVETSNKGWLFLTARADQRNSLRPFISALLDTAFNAAMTLNPDTGKLLMFPIDELPVLQQLPSLSSALAEGRKYGICIMI